MIPVGMSQSATRCLLALLLVFAAASLYSCTLSEDEIVEKNAGIILKNFDDAREAGATNTALAMHSVGIGEIDEITVVLNDEYVKEFTMVDKKGDAYCIVMNGRGYPSSISKDKLDGELLFTVPFE